MNSTNQSNDNKQPNIKGFPPEVQSILDSCQKDIFSKIPLSPDAKVLEITDIPEVTSLQYFVPLVAHYTVASMGGPGFQDTINKILPQINKLKNNVSMDIFTGDTLPYPDNSFDYAVCLHGINPLFSNRQAAIKEVNRLLVPGGQLYLLDLLGSTHSSDGAQPGHTNLGNPDGFTGSFDGNSGFQDTRIIPLKRVSTISSDDFLDGLLNGGMPDVELPFAPDSELALQFQEQQAEVDTFFKEHLEDMVSSLLQVELWMGNTTKSLFA